jgi:uncharacterized membrane protein
MRYDTRLRGTVLLALAGLFVALYLLLYHMGFYGALVCGPGSCDVVQGSKYARFLGLPVPGWGVAWYAGVFTLGLVALHPRFEEEQWPYRLLSLAATGGLAFSAYLTVVELFVLRAVCMWCVISAVITLLIFVLLSPWRAPGSYREVGSQA